MFKIHLAKNELKNYFYSYLSMRPLRLYAIKICPTFAKTTSKTDKII